ncbi:MAG TPA: amino acid--tRNA ligase-related protein, partial [Acidimicrobiales bacterium]|nr:amino acid--tRNA ligase-related protein [Acidimicrobiales bacterium]
MSPGPLGVRVGAAGSPPPAAVGLRTRYCGTLRAEDAGSVVTVCGWVAHRREHGEHLAFVDVRDYTGLLQCVVDGSHRLRAEYVVRVTGTVVLRPADKVNGELASGEVELADCTVETLSEAEPPPLDLDGYQDSDEAVRLRYRYVDLRTARMQRNLRLRAAVNAAIRHSMERQGFTEVETPFLWTPTPEGAREFAIPSRLQHGLFYVLPQSPQIAKQLTMVGGMDRYYQIARCMRDEDLRADRQFEFTQLDVEASFVGEEDVRGFVTQAVLEAAEAAAGVRPEAPVTMTWAEAIDRYGIDKPDLRFGMELIDCTGVFAATELNAFKAPVVKAIRVPGQGELGRGRLDALIERAKSLGAKGLVWMRALPGAGGSSGGATASDGAAGVELEAPVAKYLSDKEKAALV